jgi:hypothetical protein
LADFSMNLYHNSPLYNMFTIDEDLQLMLECD